VGARARAGVQLGEGAGLKEIDLAVTPLRELNAALHGPEPEPQWRVLNPRGAHALAAGVVHGNAGVGLAENIMSGRVVVDGSASQSAAATGHGGLVVIHGDASARAGISMKGVDIVVQGSVGHMSAFMAQKGRLVVCGDAGDALGDSIYEARLYVRGQVAGLGADCVEKEMREEHRTELAELLAEAEVDADASDFRRYGSARKLYNFHVDNAGAY
jgi:glutamate synthase domain-containing protein 3